MIKIAALSFLALIVGYVVGLFGGMFLIHALSTNTHDKSVESAMTAAFIIGPLTALLAGGATLVYLLASRNG